MQCRAERRCLAAEPIGADAGDGARGAERNRQVAGRRQRLRAAADKHAQTLATLNKRAARLPGTPALRKALLERVMQRTPEMRPSIMTLQHRDFESFSDADVESALRQLDALGLLDDESGE